jgi:hypothetical protein
MNSSETNPPLAQAHSVRVTTDELIVDLVDGRTVTIPLHWYPRLLHGTATQRRKWRLIGQGDGIHWPELDEDISVEALLAGRPSGESRASLQRWLDSQGLPAVGRVQRTRPKHKRSKKRSGRRAARG